jgi:hypothetical protein
MRSREGGLARKAGAGADLRLVQGKKVQLRKPSRRNWSKARENAFLSILADTCNVTLAAAEAGVSVSHAYRRRKNGAAYHRLELVLLERAFVGSEKLIRRKDGSEERMVEYPNQLALTLLKMHRDTAVEATTEVPPDDVEEIRERLLEKLERIRKRDAETA